MPTIAIIGSGLIGETHAGCLHALGANVKLFYDLDRERAEDLADRFQATVASSTGEIFADITIDAVYICTHHDTHAPLVIAAAKAKKHVFLEKPMALTRADLDAITEAIDTAGVRCMTGFKLRYYPLAEKARAFIDAPLMLSAQVSDNRWPDDSWANDVKKGGGNVLSQGCHAIDLVCHFARSKPIRVYAEGGNLHHKKLELVDALTLTLSFESGAVASVSIGDTGLTPTLGKFSFTASDGNKSFLLYDRLLRLDVRTDEAVEHYRNSAEEGFFRENKEFVTALREGREPSSTHLDGYRASMILLEAIASARTHQPRDLTHLP
jgi:predicted dehydrogenase